MYRRFAINHLLVLVLAIAFLVCAGVSANAASTDKPPIKVGVVLPLTGVPAVSGLTSQYGMRLYLEGISYKVAGRSLELIFGDDAGNAGTGLMKAKQLVESDHVQFLMGGVTSAVVYAIAPYATEMQVPYIVSGNGAAQGVMIDPKYQSPYLIRLTHNPSSVGGPAADWAYNAGYRNAILFTSDFSAGVEMSDMFASAFVARGGKIVQEIHPARATNDFGPYLAKLDPSADIMGVMLSGGELSFVEQFASYVGRGKLKVIDFYGQATNGEWLSRHGEGAIGLIAVSPYFPDLETPENRAFLKVWYDKYPGRIPTMEAAIGYSAAKALVVALEKVKGDIEGGNKQAFLKALYETNIETPRGPIKLDQFHDIVQNMYVYEVVRHASGKGLATRGIKTYPNVSCLWDRTPEQLRAFKYGHLKDKWVGMTKATLGDVITLPRNN